MIIMQNVKAFEFCSQAPLRVKSDSSAKMAMLLNAMDMLCKFEILRSVFPDNRPRFNILHAAETPVIEMKSNVAANELVIMTAITNS